ncbi:OmpA family protein [Muricoccus radiodurans]|uniref:OmpA family protein n=1 Tax=Muricoccus radiodurans TaxID=2231721 RepID=UPI003CEC46A6
MRRRALSLLLPLAAVAACAAPGAPIRDDVFFTADSALLDDAARTVINRVAASARANPNAPVRVRGFAAPDTGTATFNRTLSQARAQAVADALVGAGVPNTRVTVEASGGVAFTATPTESRRVEIVIGG